MPHHSISGSGRRFAIGFLVVVVVVVGLGVVVVVVVVVVLIVVVVLCVVVVEDDDDDDALSYWMNCVALLRRYCGKKTDMSTQV